jgi:flagellar hook-associated protein 3 FlgL
MSMRISTAWMHQQSINSMFAQQTSLAHTQLQLSSQRRILTPADDPAGSARAVDLNSFINANTQFQRNIDFANSRLAMEEQSLGAAGDVLTRIRELTLQAANASQTNETRGDIAKELRQRLEQLVQIANSRDGNGEYIFSGNATRTQPFSQGAGGVSYVGDQGTRALEIAPGQTVATNDPGSVVFQQIPTGNGYFEVGAAAGNAGTLVAGATQMTDIGAWNRASYQINFTSPTTYEVRDAANALVSSGAYDPAGTTVAFNGVQVAFSGAAVAGDSYQVAPSGSRDMFATIEAIARALETPASNEHDRAVLLDTLNRGLENIDQASTRLIDTRAGVGARMNTLDQQASINESVGIQVKATLSGIEDLDYASAIAKLNLQMLSLQAAQQTYVKVQGLSLFNYLR